MALVALSGGYPTLARAAGRLPEGFEGGAVGVRPFVSRPDLTPPAVTVSTPARGVQPGSVFTAPFTGSGQSGPLIVDNAGEPIWFNPVAGPTAMNFHVQRYRGNEVLTWWQGTMSGGYGGGTGVIMDRAYRELARVKAGHRLQSDLHEFVITSRDTALIAIYSEVGGDLSAVGGPTDGRVVEGVVQEIDIPSGRVLFEWHSLDHVGLDESYRTYPTDPGQFDYFHLNSIGVDVDGHLLVSARHTSTVYKLDRRTGEVIWRLGGKKSDFAIGPGASFTFQHDARRHADGTLTVFDNGAWAADGVVEQASRPIRLALDTKGMTATLLHVFDAPDTRLATAMGDLQLLADGGAFVGWGTAGPFSEIGPDGGLRFDARFADDRITYRAFRFPWSAEPRTGPTVVTTHDASGTTMIYVSWNGATDVTSWQVRTGTRAANLRPVHVARRTGFETVITLPSLTGYVAVAALNQAGRILGSSTPVRA